MTTGARGKIGEYRVLRYCKKIIKNLESEKPERFRFIANLDDEDGFKFSLNDQEYDIYRPRRTSINTEDLFIQNEQTKYKAMIQVKNLSISATPLTEIRSFVEKVIENEVDDGMFISLSSTVKGDLLQLFNLDYSPKKPDEFWEDDLEQFFIKTLGNRKSKAYGDKLKVFHNDVDKFFTKQENWRFRKLPIDFKKKLPWLVGINIPSSLGLTIHFVPTALFHYNNERMLFFILPKEMRMDILRSWRLQQILLDSQRVYLGITPDHDFLRESKGKNIKKRFRQHQWEIIPLDQEKAILPGTTFTVADLAAFSLFDDKLPYSKEKLTKKKISFKTLPPCIKNAYKYGVSDGRHHTTLILALIRDYTIIEDNSIVKFDNFEKECYKAANKALLAKSHDKKIDHTVKYYYYPLKSLFGTLTSLACNHNGGIWMGPQEIDKKYHQKLCDPDNRCLRMIKKDVLSYLGFTKEEK